FSPLPRSAKSWTGAPARSRAEVNLSVAPRCRALFELAVLAAPAVEPDVHWTAIMGRLTRNTSPDSGQRTAARLGDFIAAFHTMGVSLARRHACPRPQHAVHDGIIDLVLDRPVRGPTARHCRCPISRRSQGRHISTRHTRSKNANRIG